MPTIPTSVYIVEDELLIAASLKQQLEQSGYLIAGMATRGEKSLDELQELKDRDKEPEIVLMDIHLRGQMDGIETARQITERFDCAIIFLTGQSSKEIYERSFFIKPFGYILKPYDLEQTVMTVEIAAYQRKLEIENREYRRTLEYLLKEQRQANTEIMELYESIIENSLIGIGIMQDNRFVFVNKTIANILGYTTGELMSFTIRDLVDMIHPLDQERVLAILNARLNRENPPQHTIFRIFTKEGILKWTKTYVTMIHYKGRPAMHQTYLDITEYQLNK